MCLSVNTQDPSLCRLHLSLGKQTALSSVATFSLMGAKGSQNSKGWESGRRKGIGGTDCHIGLEAHTIECYIIN